MYMYSLVQTHLFVSLLQEKEMLELTTQVTELKVVTDKIKKLREEIKSKILR